MKIKYTHEKIENIYLYPFGIEFNNKPSLIWRFILWVLGFKKDSYDSSRTY